MRLKTYLEGEVAQGFLTEKAAKCILHEACKKLGFKEYEESKLHIIAGVIFVPDSEESVELGDLLYRCGGRTGG